MKDLIISIVIVAILISGWFVFFNYSENTIHSYTACIKEEIIPLIEKDRWEQGYKKMSELEDQWHDFRRLALYFLDTETINEIDYSIAKASKYVKAKDISNSSGELNAVIEQLRFLSQNDELTLNNIL